MDYVYSHNANSAAKANNKLPNRKTRFLSSALCRTCSSVACLAIQEDVNHPMNAIGTMNNGDQISNLKIAFSTNDHLVF